MPRRALGRSGVVVSAVGWSTRVLAHPDESVSPADLVRAALDADIDLFDSSPEGDTRYLLARALGGSRRRVALGARCVPVTGPAALVAPERCWRPEEVRLQLEEALRHLQSDWVDLWLLQDPSEEALADDDLWARLAADRDAGWIRAVGVAVAGEDAARTALEQGGIDALALPMSLAEPEPGRALAADAAGQDVAVLVDNPLAGDAPDPYLLHGLVYPDTDRTPAQALLAGVLSFTGVSSLLTPAATPSEIGAHAGAAEMPLSEAETRSLAARLDEARESQREP
ncbi:MAG: aldo/keto reductase [Acidimicrobiia bacterium]